MTNANDPINTWNPKRPWNDESDNGYAGLTKREYFAAMAMQGLLADSNSTGSLIGFAEDSVRMADLLIKELNKEQ